MVTVEYALIAGINDDPGDAAELARIARSLRAKINLIPYNPTVSRYEAPASERLRRFTQALEAAGARFTVRREKGREIQAACGQLRSRCQGRRDHDPQG